NPGDYTYTVQGTTPCPADAAVVSVTVVAAPDAGTPGSATLCATDAAMDLFAQLGGTPDAGGTWTGPSTVNGGLYDLATMTPGVYTYTISVPPPCTNASSTVTITEVAPPNAGTDGALTLCISSPAADLFDALGGTPDAGGTWTGPSTVTGGLFNPATMNPGDYTYTVQGSTPCPADAAVVSVTVVAAPDAGTPGSATLCATDAAMDLFAQLGGTPDAGGTWTGPSTVNGGLYDLATMTPGVYTYTISVPPPCTNASSTVTITEVAPPNAGTDGALTLCISSPAADLFDALGGTPDAGGTWTGPSTVTGGLFNPATMNPGDYTYTVQGSTPCPADAAVVSVTVVAAPDAGTDDILNLCASGDPVDLFPALGGAQPNGTWAGPGGGAFNGLFIPGSSPAGNYTYTVAGMPPCPSSTATIEVNVVTDADAGGDGMLSICSSDAPVSLFSLLQGTPHTGGDWYLPNGAPFGGVLDPQSHPGGTYSYVVSVPLPCVNDTSLVTVGITQAVYAGTDSSLTLCSSDGPISMADHLGGNFDETGSWTGPNGPTSVAFYPGIDTPGAYTYMVPGTAPCPNASATITITVNPMPFAGLDGNITVCPEAPAVQLFSVLGGTPDTGGSWTAPNGLPHGPSFDPAGDMQGAYTYTVYGPPACPNDQATATVNIHVVPVPNAGPDQVSCTYEATLGATGTWASGLWAGPAGTTIQDPASPTTPVTVAAGGAYTFTWSTVSAQGCASSDSVTITFTDPILLSVETTGTLCYGSCDGEATVAATGGNVLAGNYVYQWSSGSTGTMPLGIGFCAGDYTVTALDTNNCAATTSFTILQPEPLTIYQLSATPTLCPESCDGTILITDPEGVLFAVNGGDLLPINLITGLCAGVYTVTMLDANGCSATTSATITSPDPVHAGFSVHPDTVAINAPVVELTNTSSANATHFAWSFGDGTTSNEVSPTHQFPMGAEAVYTICLTATTDNGCPDTYCVPLPVVGLPGLYVPNAFTPDGDGRNDVFLVSGNRISPEGFQLLVFDRWGEKIFEANDPAQGWDGRRNGTEAMNDVYVWKLTFHFQGSIEMQEMLGHVTLVR
ncbi:MAG TPA: gliding motility-associated C-terminal domain-containing protein, partial [Flavobacteriales bacterium]|nr:gliding motility-associated C-terminal domain-containing protein [Flavobacteriales bacterium]